MLDTGLMLPADPTHMPPDVLAVTARGRPRLAFTARRRLRADQSGKREADARHPGADMETASTNNARQTATDGMRNISCG